MVMYYVCRPFIDDSIMTASRSHISAWVLILGLVLAQTLHAGHYHDAHADERVAFDCTVCAVDTFNEADVVDSSSFFVGLPCIYQISEPYSSVVAWVDFSLAQARAPPFSVFIII